jgi:protein gp37
MGEHTKISWCDDTFNPWIGCTKISVGTHGACEHCYAEHLMDHRMGRVNWGPHGERKRTSEANWKQPLKWSREAAKAGQPRFVFCASLADVFDNQVPAEWRRDLFDLIRATPHLTWLLLTKRPGNIVKLFMEALATSVALGLDECWPRNAAIGCTVVTQAEADRDIPVLLAAKAALNPAFAFLSIEPMLGPIDLTLLRPKEGAFMDALRGFTRAPGSHLLDIGEGPKLDWIITGGETDQGKHKARMMNPAWARSIRDQCSAAGVPFHLKQMTRKALVPADLQIQERPRV